MRMNAKATISIAAFLALCTPVFNQLQAQSYRVAIMPFKQFNMQGDYATFVESLPEMLSTNLAMSDGITVVERSQIDKAIENHEIEQTDLFNPATVAKIGKWLGASHIVLGSVTAIGDQVRIDLRIVDANYGEVVKTAKVNGTLGQLFDLVDVISENILKNLTGERLSISAKQNTYLDKCFTLEAPIPSPQKADCGGMLYNGDSPNIVVGYDIHYECDIPKEANNKTQKFLYLVLSGYCPYPISITINVNGYLMAAITAENPNIPQNEAIVDIGDQRLKVLFVPMGSNVSSAFSEKLQRQLPIIKDVRFRIIVKAQ
jgi:TolB-like protein